MNTVQPIRDLEALGKCYAIAREHDRKARRNEACWEALLEIGFNTGLRVSDFRLFKVDDLRGKQSVALRAKKTGKEASFRLNQDTVRALKTLLAGRKGDEYVFQSREKDMVTGQGRPLSRQRIYQIINKIAREAGIEEKIGCHTLRKTFGYHHYQENRDAVTLMNLFGHAGMDVTLRYIGITQDKINESTENLRVLSGRNYK